MAGAPKAAPRLYAQRGGKERRGVTGCGHPLTGVPMSPGTRRSSGGSTWGRSCGWCCCGWWTRTCCSTGRPPRSSRPAGASRHDLCPRLRGGGRGGHTVEGRHPQSAAARWGLPVVTPQQGGPHGGPLCCHLVPTGSECTVLGSLSCHPMLVTHIGVLCPCHPPPSLYNCTALGSTILSPHFGDPYWGPLSCHPH